MSIEEAVNEARHTMSVVDSQIILGRKMTTMSCAKVRNLCKWVVQLAEMVERKSAK